MHRVYSRPHVLVAAYLVALTAFLCAGCDDGPTSCTADMVPGISIKVIDAETNLPAACVTTAWLISDSYSEEVTAEVGCDRPDSFQYAWLHGASPAIGRSTTDMALETNIRKNIPE